MAITQEFDLNLIPDQEPVVVHVSQYDIGAGRLIAHLYDGDLAYTPTAGATVTIQGTKPDHYGFMYDATLSGNTVTADLTEQMCAVAGRTVVNIIVLESDNRTGTFNFFLDVQKAALGNDTVISASDGSIFDIPTLVEEAEQSAEDAEAWANGTRNGVDVPSTDQAYHKNAKYYAETSGDNVEESEAWAKGTRNGVDVPSTDQAYHKNAKYYAETSGDNVEESEAWAKGTKNGVAVPSTDDTYHNNSKYYAEQAENSADHAADIVNDANYLIGVNPTTIGNPESGWSKVGRVYGDFTIYDTLAHMETKTPPSSQITIPANDGRYVYARIDDQPNLVDKTILAITNCEAMLAIPISFSLARYNGIPMIDIFIANHSTTTKYLNYTFTLMIAYKE